MGQGRIFVTKPVRQEHFGIWCGQMIGAVSSVVSLFEEGGFVMPDIKWTDEPIELVISLTAVKDEILDNNLLEYKQ